MCCKNHDSFFFFNSELWHYCLKQVTDRGASHFYIRWKDSACLVSPQGLGADMITWVAALRPFLRNVTAQETALTTSGSKHRTRLLLCDLISFQWLSWWRMTSSHSFSLDGHLWMSLIAPTLNIIGLHSLNREIALFLLTSCWNVSLWQGQRGFPWLGSVPVVGFLLL